MLKFTTCWGRIMGLLHLWTCFLAIEMYWFKPLYRNFVRLIMALIKETAMSLLVVLACKKARLVYERVSHIICKVTFSMKSSQPNFHQVKTGVLRWRIAIKLSGVPFWLITLIPQFFVAFITFLKWYMTIILRHFFFLFVQMIYPCYFRFSRGGDRKFSGLFP